MTVSIEELVKKVDRIEKLIQSVNAKASELDVGIIEAMVLRRLDVDIELRLNRIIDKRVEEEDSLRDYYKEEVDHILHSQGLANAIETEYKKVIFAEVMKYLNQDAVFQALKKGLER